MLPYSQLIDELLIGETPKEKYENLKFMIDLLRTIAYPKRGTYEERVTVFDIATMIQEWFPLSELSGNGAD